MTARALRLGGWRVLQDRGRPRQRAGRARAVLPPKTIRNNVTSILAKLQATDRAEVIIRARDAGLGTGEPS